jgi:indole-3-glycerol phosphate synthase/phosphoribosylanthranilate isomerase
VRLREALSANGLGAVAEFKRRSPSTGDIRPGADPVAYARAYERGGASALSILVDERFGGSVDDLAAARAATALPLLAKGFFADESTLARMHEAGADAVLLILRDLDDGRVGALQAYARGLGMDALVEAHDAGELERAVSLGADPIGINARDLSTFSIDRDAQLRLVARAPKDRLVIAESAVHTRAQGAAAEVAGADAMLVGTALMQAADPEAKLAELLSRPLVKVCGLTRQEDVDVAVEAGADLVGFILAVESPRRAEAVLAVPETVLSVAVFVEDVHDAGADLVQYYRRVNGHRGRDAVLLRGDEQVATVVDLPWLEDDPTHLERARATEGRVMLAGGLDGSNVRAAIDAVRPWAVDASSRLEREPGLKDREKVRRFIGAAR